MGVNVCELVGGDLNKFKCGIIKFGLEAECEK
jgi:hypothetical protein